MSLLRGAADHPRACDPDRAPAGAPARPTSAAANASPIARKASRPSPGSENASPASGVPTRMTRTAEPLTRPDRRGGCVGSQAQRHVEDGCEREAGGEAGRERGERGEPERRRGREHEDGGGADAECSRDERPRARSQAPDCEPAGRARDDACEEDEPADDARDAAAVTLVLEQGDDPVARDDGKAESRHLHGGERPQAAIADDAAPRRLADRGRDRRRAFSGPQARGAHLRVRARGPSSTAPASRAARRAAARSSARALLLPSWRRRRRLARTGRPFRRERDRCLRRIPRRSRAPSAAARRGRARLTARRGRSRSPPRRSPAQPARPYGRRSCRSAGRPGSARRGGSRRAPSSGGRPRRARRRRRRLSSRRPRRCSRRPRSPRPRARGPRRRSGAQLPATRAIVESASRSSARTESSRCSSRVSSSFVWERPRRLCTNIITVGTPARATSAAS